MITLNERLHKVSQYIQGDTLVDIGSDHAYLPIYAIQHQLVKYAIAGEVIRGPYEASVKNVQLHQFTEQINVRLGDGLSILNESEPVGTITICGMGGPLIAKILKQGSDKLQFSPRLVLQSNIQTGAIRQLLNELNYEIIDELIFEEKGHMYEIVVADYNRCIQPLDETEIKFGPKLIKEKSPEFEAKWNRELEALKNIISHLDPERHESRVTEIDKEIKMIERVLNYDR